ncbi:MAG: 3D domain-containing protein [Bacilli bacterium]
MRKLIGNRFLAFIIAIIVIQVAVMVVLVKLGDKGKVLTPSPTNSPNITNPVKPFTTAVPTTTPEAIHEPHTTRPTVVSRDEERYIDTFIGCITMYTEGYKSCGKYPSHPEYGITASGKRVKANHTIAMDKRFPFGTLVRVEGFDTIFEVEDRGGAITGNDVDIYIPEYPDGEKKAFKWGVQERQVWILRWGKDDDNGEHALHQLSEQNRDEEVPGM